MEVLMIYLQLLYNLDSYIQCEKCSNKQKEKIEIHQYKISYHRDSVFGTLITLQKCCIVHAWTPVWALVEHLGTDFTLQLWREGEGTSGIWEQKTLFSDPAKEIGWTTTKDSWCHQQMFDPHNQEQPTKSTKLKKNLLSMIARAHRRGRTPIRAIRSLLWELRVQAMKWSSSAPTLIQIISLVIIININMLSAPSRDSRHQQIGGFGHSG